MNKDLQENINSSLVLQTIKNHIKKESHDAFFVVDLQAIANQHLLWKSKLPNVKPFYAVKCNPDEKILKLMIQQGCGFDCASKEEIKTVLRLNAKPSDIIYANSIKEKSHIQYAKEQGVTKMTFDNKDELIKIKEIFPKADLLLRIFVNDSHSQCPLGTKFGAPAARLSPLLTFAKELNLNVVGVSFHVGSGCLNSKAFTEAIYDAKKVFELAKSLGYDMTILDIGGGFPGYEKGPMPFEVIADECAIALEKNFPSSSGIEVIAEPGRFYVSRSHTLAVCIIGRNIIDLNETEKKTNLYNQHYMYYLNDGIYGSFNCLLYDNANVIPKVFKSETNESFSNVSCSLWGPTCDGADFITKETSLPILNIGEWIYFEEMGAYTSAAGSCFNGFQLPKKLYINENILI